MNGPSLDVTQERQAKFRAGRTFYRCGMFTQGFVDFTFSKGRKLRITRCMPPILCGKTVLCLKRGPNQKRSAQPTRAPAVISPSILGIRSLRGSRFARR
jgi:hypothetical protein